MHIGNISDIGEVSTSFPINCFPINFSIKLLLATKQPNLILDVFQDSTKLTVARRYAQQGHLSA